jgi:hypothetical protein
MGGDDRAAAGRSSAPVTRAGVADAGLAADPEQQDAGSLDRLADLVEGARSIRYTQKAKAAASGRPT